MEKRWKMQARADSLAQIVTIREFVATHHGRYAGEREFRRLPGLRRIFDPAEMQERLDYATKLKRETKESMLAHLKRATDLGPYRRVATAPGQSAFEAISQDFPHFTEVTAYLRRSAALSMLGTEKRFKVRPILLAGEPGVGKTAYVQAASAAIGAPLVTQDVGSISAGFSLSGLDAGYESGRPGLVYDALNRCDCMSPTVVLDELDKLGSDTRDTHLNALYSLLESVTATAFIDAYAGVALDASYINWFGTCNYPDLIEPALRSRFQRFDVPAPTPTQMRAVIESIQSAILSTEDWAAAFPEDLDEAVIERLARLTPRDASSALRDAYASAAADGRRSLSASDVSEPNASHRPVTIGFIN